MSKEAMKLALEAMERYQVKRQDFDRFADEITALREALANEALDKKAENARELGLDYEPARDSGIVTAGGADPRTQRTWVGLTNDEVNEFAAGCHLGNSVQGAIYKAVAKLKEKNT